MDVLHVYSNIVEIPETVRYSFPCDSERTDKTPCILGYRVQLGMIARRHRGTLWEIQYYPYLLL